MSPTSPRNLAPSALILPQCSAPPPAQFLHPGDVTVMRLATKEKQFEANLLKMFLIESNFTQLTIINIAISFLYRTFCIIGGIWLICKSSQQIEN